MLQRLLIRVHERLARGVAAAPEAADALVEQALAEEAAGRSDLAVESLRKALALAPRLVRAHVNLGTLLEAQGDVASARRAYETGLSIDGGNTAAAYNLAKLDYVEGRLAEAGAALAPLLRRKPDFVDAWVLQSNVLDSQGRTEEAAEAIEAALRLQPDYPGALYNQAVIQRQLGRFDAAADAAERAAALEPTVGEYFALRGSLALRQGFPQQALDCFRRACELEPTRIDVRAKELFAMSLVEGVPAEAMLQRHREIAAFFEAAVPYGLQPPTTAGSGRLRVGYVSGDLKTHPVSLFLLPVLERTDRQRFEVTCYSSTVKPDRITHRLQVLAEHWTDVSALDDGGLFNRIRADGIDILIDLGGYTGDTRLLTFAARAAPVQIAWMGYLNTTGLSQMDFRLTDERCDPPQTSVAHHTETLLYLPASQWCFRPFVEVPTGSRPAFERKGFVTFGSFNNIQKIDRPQLLRWGRILAAVPGARLCVVGAESERKRSEILAGIAEGGGEHGRVIFTPRLDLVGYYNFFAEVDIALDSHPYGGGTTTFDALWSGVPVLTMTGDTPPSRSAASILAALGLDDWIAADADAFVARAVAHAADTGALARLHATLRGQLKASPLMDEAGFVQAYEAALELAWQHRRPEPAGAPTDRTPLYVQRSEQSC